MTRETTPTPIAPRAYLYSNNFHSIWWEHIKGAPLFAEHSLFLFVWGRFFPPDQYEHDQAMEDSDQSKPPDSAQLSRQPQIGSAHQRLFGDTSFYREIFFATASESASPVNIIGFSFNFGSRHSLEDLDYVRTIRPWQNKNSKRPNRMHSGRRSWIGWHGARWYSQCSVRDQRVLFL